MLIIVDNTVLTNFALIDRVDILNKATEGEAIIPEQVQIEFNEGVRLGYFPDSDLSWAKVESMLPEEVSIWQLLLNRLGEGEAACLALAQSREGQVWTDDRLARLTCNQLQLPVSGTIGVLALSIDKEILSLAGANHCLHLMIQNGYYSPADSLDEFL